MARLYSVVFDTRCRSQCERDITDERCYIVQDRINVFCRKNDVTQPSSRETSSVHLYSKTVHLNFHRS